MDYVNWATAHWDSLLAILGGVVAVASVVVKLTPSQADDAILAKVIGVLNHFSVFNPNKPPVVMGPVEAPKA